MLYCRDEYDATILYNAKMQKDVRGNNSELTEQLYTHDAATRVIRALTEQMIKVGCSNFNFNFS